MDERPDVETASADYARRFSGPVGEWFLEVQRRVTLDLLRPYARSSVLDVGGGHGQLTGPLVEAGFRVTVHGSAEQCRERVRPWVDSGRARFVSGPLTPLPFGDGEFDVVLAYRLLPHVEAWRHLLAEMCRVARQAVILDYPTLRSANLLSRVTFSMKKGVEGNTRPFAVFREREMADAIGECGFRVTARRPEFVLPMALHRAVGAASPSRALESGLDWLGVTQLIGSPVILRLEPGAREVWPLALYRRSVLKQRKLAELRRAIGSTESMRCLDLGSDNGVVSLLLRRDGGRWASADLTEESVGSIRELVGSDVHRTDGATLPFADAEFDRVAVVDMLEHVEDEDAFVRELARVTRPGGRLIVNTPHLKESLLRRFRHAIGQTDEKHGHVRPGYTPARLAELFGGSFEIESHHTYSRFFSELVDTAINFAVEKLGKKGSAKGMIVTGKDVQRHAKQFRAYSLLYPLVWLVSRFDYTISFASGYMLIARAVRLEDRQERASGAL